MVPNWFSLLSIYVGINGVSGRYIAMFLESFLTFLDQQVVDKGEVV